MSNALRPGDLQTIAQAIVSLRSAPQTLEAHEKALRDAADALEIVLRQLSVSDAKRMTPARSRLMDLPARDH